MLIIFYIREIIIMNQLILSKYVFTEQKHGQL